MKGEITLKILETIEDLVVNTSDLLDAILSSGYGASRGKIEYEFSKNQAAGIEKRIEKEFQKQLRQKYYNLIYKLKESGLIKEEEKNHKKILSITRKGKDKLSLLKEQDDKKLPSKFYKKEKRNKFVIVIFDIPERERRKRDWLRFVLANLEFEMIQKSVWLGKNKIPKNFLDDLRNLNLIDFVEIFEISKSGSLKQVA